MAQSKTALALLLVLTITLFSEQATALGCCRKYSKGQVPFGLIRGYSIQTMKRNCNINAVIFHTSTGRNVCADPSQAWVMDSIWKLREKVQSLKSKHGKKQ